MNTLPHKNPTVQNDPIVESVPDNNDEHVHRFPDVLLNHLGLQGVMTSVKKKIGLVLVIPMMAIVMIAVHLVAGIFLVKTSSADETNALTNPMLFIVVGVLLVVVLIKFRLLSGFLRRGHRAHSPQSEAE